MKESTTIKIPFSHILFYVLAILFCTYFRILLLPAYPLIVLFIFYAFKWKVNRNAVYLLFILAVLWAFSLRDGFYLKYNLVSLYYYIPFLLMLFASPSSEKHPRNDLHIFMKALTVVVIINNIPGIIQYFINPGDDNFVGIYGRFTVSQNGLSLLNGLLFFYHFLTFLETKNTTNFLFLLFFLACSIMGFYGAGVMVLLIAIGIYFLRSSVKTILTLTAVLTLTAGSMVMLMKIVSPDTLNYNIAIIKRFVNSSPEQMPRKLTIFHNYASGYLSHPVDFLFGSGPGTFNSRSAFMVGSPTYFHIDALKSDNQPYYFKNYAYPLWNASNTGPYDGFMNQPFTSILNLLGEYGFLFTFILFALLIQNFKRFGNKNRQISINPSFAIHRKVYRFTSIYILLLILIDNYIEYPEIMALLIIIVKLCEQQLRKGKEEIAAA